MPIWRWTSLPIGCGATASRSRSARPSFACCKHFLENPGRVFSREQLLDTVWPHEPDIELRTVDVHVRRLRQALNGGGRADLIRTVRSAGYSLDAEA